MRHTFHTDRKSNPESTPGAFGKRLRLLGAVALLGCTGTAWAAGTAAGTSISNTATLSYTVGNSSTTTTIESSPTGNNNSAAGSGAPTSFVVDRKIDVQVVHNQTAATSATVGEAGAITSFTVTNLGNSVQDFLLTPEALVAGNSTTNPPDPYTGSNAISSSTFQATACTAWVSPTSTGTYTSATYIDELAPDITYYVQLRCDMPTSGTGQTNGDTALVNLRAQAAASGCEAAMLGSTAAVPVTNTACGTTGSAGAAVTATAGADTAGVDTVFGDAAGRFTGDGERDGKHSARAGYIILSAIPTVTKTSTLMCDPLNKDTNPKHIPGAVVKYTVTVANDTAAGANAKLTSFADTLNSNLEFVGDNYASVDPANCAVTTVNTIPATNTPLSITCSGAAPERTACTAPAGSASLSGSLLTVTYQSGTITTMPEVTSGTTAADGELRPGETVTVEFYVRIQ